MIKLVNRVEQKQIKHVVSKRMHLSNVPGDGACGFTSIAVGAIDTCFCDPQGTGQLQNDLLKLYLMHYPNHATRLKDSTDLDKLKSLMQINGSTENFFVKLGFCIRQLAVTKEQEIRQEIYGSKNFQFDPKQTDENNMRNHFVWISQPYIKAASDALGIRIGVQNEQGEMRRDLFYPETETSRDLPTIYLKLEGNHYRPYITTKNDYQQAHDKGYSAALQPSARNSNPQEIKDTEQEIIRKHDKQQAQSYEEAKIQLADLTIDELRNLYRQQKNGCDYLKGRIKYMDIESNLGSNFYTKFLGENRDHLDHTQPQPTKEQIRHELKHALARSMSIGNEHLINAVDTLTAQKGHRMSM